MLRQISTHAKIGQEFLHDELAKANDPDYLPLRGHVYKDVARRFKAICSIRGIDFGAGMEEALMPWIEEEEKRLLPLQTRGLAQPEPSNIAELVQQNYYKLVSNGKIKPENLQAIASGSEPSKADLRRIAQILGIDVHQLEAMWGS